MEHRLQYTLFFHFLNYHPNRLFLYFLVNYQTSIFSLLLLGIDSQPWIPAVTVALEILEACLPIHKKRQRDYRIFLFTSLSRLTLVQQRDKSHAISRNSTCTIFIFSSPGIKRMFEITLTSEVRQCTLDCYDMIEQSACLTQASKFYIAVITGSRKPA